ncbi:uncharacterized protein LOC128036141 [Gossypium raimondii]|uniref:uncharacterized protein LOC128036141 n=1 Tax=Gossypium raimondii TaxID=29730 RepID=UPI00227BC779|nr:uncharacterized protein LOC128036141 [Gossypium raimondii]
MAPYEALYGCRCRTPTCWAELDERRVLGSKLVSVTKEKIKLIRDRLKEASDRQKSYTDLKRERFSILWGTTFFLRIIEPCRILKRVGPVAYQLELRPELDWIHDVFYVSMLRRYRFDPTHIVSVEEIEVRPDLTFEEGPVQRLDHEVKVLRKKSIPLVKVLWYNHSSEEATWELE